MDQVHAQQQAERNGKTEEENSPQAQGDQPNGSPANPQKGLFLFFNSSISPIFFSPYRQSAHLDIS